MFFLKLSIREKHLDGIAGLDERRRLGLSEEGTKLSAYSSDTQNFEIDEVYARELEMFQHKALAESCVPLSKFQKGEILLTAGHVVISDKISQTRVIELATGILLEDKGQTERKQEKNCSRNIVPITELGFYGKINC